MLRPFFAFLAFALFLASSGLAGPAGGIRTRVETLRSTLSSLSKSEIRFADLGSRVEA